MRLYTRSDASGVDDPEYGHFDADEQGGFDFPDELSNKLYSFHFRGKPLWETDIERQARLMAEEMERRRDPATLMDAVQQLVNAAQAVTPPDPQVAKRATTKRSAKADPAG